ncbi:sugar ABC transporter ATP-binding protein [Pararhodobacter sp.]|uniref:sugar ABC transporter ATP-binding protein n=1 Tax=Pararhodobacter sp. TaxID=2127056 RepID=UPI002FDCC80F
MTDPVLDLSRIVKDFPGVRALNHASLRLNAGEIHGLVGENGAGKSTIIKVLAGVYTPEEGSLHIGGRPVDQISPASVHAAGVRFIHQELHLVSQFTVAESVFMGQELQGRFGLRTRLMRERAEAFLRDVLGVAIPGNKLVRDLGTAERKLVQIARALIDEQARIVVFDEPTAPLASEEVRTLMGAIARLKARGITILYVSHYLNEITDICDRVTVFRNGSDVAVFDDVHEGLGPAMISAMVGRSLNDIYPTRARRRGAEVLSLEAFSGKGFDAVDLRVHRGEILGVAGLIGSGREELVDTLYGLLRASGGRVRLHGRSVTLRSPADAISQGLALVPRDRRHDGLVLPMTLGENITLATLEADARMGLENRARANARSAQKIRELDIRPANPQAIVRFLSGGNQQKVVLARWLARQADVFILDEPTVGVDIGARSEIYGVVDRLAQAGAGVIVSSSDPGELIGLCDSIVVMMRGKVVARIDPAQSTIDQLIALTTGAVTTDPEHEAAI